MKNLMTIISLAFLCLQLHAQTPINKSIPTSSVSSIEMNFDYPELIKISSWDKNEVSITGTVSINGGENDDAFKLTTITSGNVLTIKGEVPDIKDLPHRITAVKGGNKMTFKNKAEFDKYKKENGGNFEMTNWGNDIEITLEIKIPKNIQANIKSVYGVVELKGLNQSMPLIAKSTYGGVDAALNTNSIGEVFASSDYGEIYSNLGLKFSSDGLKQGDFHKEIIARPGKGAKYTFESKYGNVYMRKEN